MNRFQRKKSEHNSSLLAQADSLGDRVARAMRANGVIHPHAEQDLRYVITLRNHPRSTVSGDTQRQGKSGPETSVGHAAPVPHPVVNKGEFR
ncbi:hypothetical protein [Labrenzia sp. 011]|uniref:hypothetical protein n=1 Tax=Labrenzia sp. 011 TaxID=2171494 RepID=UPI00105715AF|nr:hypothetical protein [Labrenzia sp. 011]